MKTRQYMQITNSLTIIEIKETYLEASFPINDVRTYVIAMNIIITRQISANPPNPSPPPSQLQLPQSQSPPLELLSLDEELQLIS